MKNLILALAATLSTCAGSPAFAGTPKGVLNPDGSITYTVMPNDDLPKHPGPLAAVEVGNTGIGAYQWQPITDPLGVGDNYLISWDCSWSLEMSVQGQYLCDVGGAFAGHHGGTSYSGAPEYVHHYTPPAATREVPRRLRNLFVGKGDVDLDWTLPSDANSNSVSAWSESTGHVGTGFARNALNIEFQVTYYPATL